MVRQVFGSRSVKGFKKASKPVSPHPPPSPVIRALISIDDGDDSENVILKMNSRCFNLSRIYSNSLKMSNTGEFPWSWFIWDRNHVWKEKENYVAAYFVLHYTWN